MRAVIERFLFLLWARNNHAVVNIHANINEVVVDRWRLSFLHIEGTPAKYIFDLYIYCGRTPDLLKDVSLSFGTFMKCFMSVYLSRSGSLRDLL